jgi:hypothetical protein
MPASSRASALLQLDAIAHDFRIFAEISCRSRLAGEDYGSGAYAAFVADMPASSRASALLQLGAIAHVFSGCCRDQAVGAGLLAKAVSQAHMPQL